MNSLRLLLRKIHLPREGGKSLSVGLRIDFGFSVGVDAFVDPFMFFTQNIYHLLFIQYSLFFKSLTGDHRSPLRLVAVFGANENSLRHFLTKMPPPPSGRQIAPAVGIDVFVGNVVPDVPRNAEDSVPYSRI